MFAWFRAHPTRDRPLSGLLVMDEAQNFVPSGVSNPSTESTVELIRQIRKYGLGVVLASQAPRGIHNQAVGNAANQFIGRLTVTAQLRAAEDMGQARNSDLDNLGGLPLGNFYAASEGTRFSRIEVPICLSHHAGPLREDEVVERAHPYVTAPSGGLSGWERRALQRRIVTAGIHPPHARLGSAELRRASPASPSGWLDRQPGFEAEHCRIAVNQQCSRAAGLCLPKGAPHRLRRRGRGTRGSGCTCDCRCGRTGGMRQRAEQLVAVEFGVEPLTGDLAGV